MVGACGGGGGGGSSGGTSGGEATPSGIPRIAANVLTFQVENIPPPVLAAGGNSLVVVNITDSQSATPITTATVSANGTPLPYVDSLKAYRGWLILSTGDSVTLSAAVGQTAYSAVGSVPPSYPQIQSPQTPTIDVFMVNFDRTKDAFVSWNGELPNGNFHYAVAVLNETGDLVWPANGSLQAAVIGKATTIPATSIPSNFPYIATGSAQSLPIAGAASGSTLTMGAFSGATIFAPTSEPPLTLTTLKITPSPVSMIISRQVQLAVVGQLVDQSTRTQVQDLTNRVAWSSNSPGIVSVNATGQLTAVSNGVATITAQMNGVSTTQAVSVFQPSAPPVVGDAYAYQMNASHTGSTTFSAPLVFPSAAAWTVQFPDSVSYPIITSSSVFVLASQGQAAGNSGVSMYAFDAATGNPQWGPVVLTTNPGVNFTYDQGRLMTVSRNCTMQGFDATTGTVTWSVDLSNDSVWSCGSVPTAYRGIVYAVGSGVESTVFAIDIASGKVMWATKIIGDGTAPAVTDDGVYVTGYLQAYKLDPYSGVLIWHYVGPGSGGGQSTAAVYGNQVYMRGFAGTPNLIFDAQTSIITGTFASLAIPAFGNGGAYFLDSSHSLNATSLPDQTPLWSATDPGSIVSAPIIVNNVVISGTASGLVKAYDASNGSPAWSLTVDAPVTAADEVNLIRPVTGMAAGHGLLAVAASNVLSIYRMTGP
jgi:outer membrane protein assembly factor BamB